MSRHEIAKSSAPCFLIKIRKFKTSPKIMGHSTSSERAWAPNPHRSIAVAVGRKTIYFAK